MSTNDSNNTNPPLSKVVNRRLALRAALLPAAAAVLGGCANTLKTASNPPVKGRLGATRRDEDGTIRFRNHVVRDQDGRVHRFHDDLVKGQIFAVTFGYMECTGICLDIVKSMRGASDMLGSLMGNPVRFYHFSLTGDSPEVLRATMKRDGTYGRPGHYYLTAEPAIVKDIRYSFGFFERDETDEDLGDHTGMARFGHHSLDKWSACPALGSPNSIARSIVWLFPTNQRPQIAGLELSDPVNVRRTPGWVPAKALEPRPMSI
jgi:protein SCO1